MVGGYSARKCPECGSKMTYVRGANTFDGIVPDEYVCHECGYKEELMK